MTKLQYLGSMTKLQYLGSMLSTRYSPKITCQNFLKFLFQTMNLFQMSFEIVHFRKLFLTCHICGFYILHEQSCCDFSVLLTKLTLKQTTLYDKQVWSKVAKSTTFDHSLYYKLRLISKILHQTFC